MTYKNRFLAATALASAVLPLAGGQAFAQGAAATAGADAADTEARSGQVDDIVVSARKRDESSTSVPLSITAVTSQTLSALNVESTVKLSDYTPGFNQRQQVGGVSGMNSRLFNNLVFRGLNLSGNSGLTAAGLLFVDGAPVISGQVAGLGDIERVEVLRGPQSAYFGRSTFAGAINYITKTPSDTFKASLAAEYSSFGSTNDSVSFEGPILPGLRVRLGGQHIVVGGQYENAANRGEMLGRQETNSVSGSVYATPVDGLSIKAYASYFELRDGAPAQAALKPSEANCAPGRTVRPYFCGVVPRIAAQNISANNTVDAFAYQQLFQNVTRVNTIFDPMFSPRVGLSQDTFQSDVIVNYEIGGYTLTSVTAFHTSKTQAVADIAYRDARNVPNPNFGLVPNTAPYVWWLNVSQVKATDFDQELRISSPSASQLRFVAGANYIAGKQVGPNNYGLSTFGTAGFTNGDIYKAQTPSVFGGAYFDIARNLTVSGEARYQWDKVTQVTTNASRFEKTFRSFSPRVTLDYQFMPNSTLYVLWSRGYRPGGFNTGLVDQPKSVIDQVQAAAGSNLSYEQERIDNFEAGIKARFWDGKATASLSVYTGSLSDQLSSSTVSAFLPSGQIRLFTITTNLGKTRFNGVEFEGSVRPIPQLLLSATYAYNNTSIRRFNCAECETYITGSANVQGKRLPGVPRTTGTLVARYTDRLAGDWDWYGHADFVYQGSVFADYANLAETGDLKRVNLRLGVDDGKRMFEVFVENLTKADTYAGLVRGVDAITFNYNELRVALPALRTFGIRGRFRY